MAFPSISATQSGTTGTNTTSHSVTLPTHSIGDFLVVLWTFREDSAAAPDGSITAITSGWNIDYRTMGLTNDGEACLIWKVAESASETLSLTTGETGDGAAIARTITGGNRLAYSVGGSTLGTNYDAPAVYPQETRDYLVMLGFLNISNVTPTAPPANYSGTLTTTDNGSAEVAVAHRFISTLSEDPGTWTNSTTSSGDGWHFTIAIWQDDLDLPVINGSATTNISPAATTHNVTLPAHSAGDLLVAFAVRPSSQQIHPGDDGWQRAYRGSHMVVWKIAESASETLNWECNTSVVGAWIAYSISNANDIELEYGTNLDVDPLKIVNVGSPSALHISCGVNWGGSATVPSAAPLAFQSLVTATTDSNSHIFSAYRTNPALATTNNAPTVYTDESWTVTTTANRSTFGVFVFNRGTETIRRKFRMVSYATGASNLADLDRLYTTDGWAEQATNISTNANFDTADSQLGGYGDSTTGQIDFSYSDRTGIETGYIEWSGTLEELGVPAGATVTGVSDAAFRWGWVNTMNNPPDAVRIGDVDGGEGALAFDDGSTVHTLIGDVTHGTGSTNGFATMSTPITGLSLASTTSVNLRLHVDFDGNVFSSSGAARHEFDNLEVVFDYQFGGNKPQVIFIGL